jgi:hypothetical protein
MSHKKLGPIKKRLKTYDVAELRVLLLFIQAMLGSMKGGRARAGRKAHRSGAKKHHRSRKLSVGVHRHVKVGKMFRDVRVMANGKWRFI